MLNKYIVSTALVILLLMSYISAHAQNTFPRFDGDRVNYEMQIDVRGNFISGICVILQEKDLIKGSIVNEFGVSIIDFTYNMNKDKVKLHYVFKALNKWYIRRVLRRDLKTIMALMRDGKTSFNDAKHKLIFTFKVNHDFEK